MSAADAVLLLHAAFVLFVVAGLAAIWIGGALGRPFAFNPWFRGAHLGAIAFVVLQSLLGYLCPLTIWEDQLRGEATQQGFIERWVHAWMYWNWPAWVFNAIYVAFGLLVVWAWLRYPPRRTSERAPRRG